MPNLRSSFKRVKVAEKKAAQNRPIRTKARTFVSRAEKSILTDTDTAQDAVVEAIVALDRAASQGVIHKNNAARRKSRLMKKLNGAKESG